MLYDNEQVLQYLDEEHGKLIHLYGEPDAGRTSVMFSWIDALIKKEKPCAYLVPRKNDIQARRFRRYIKDLSMCPMIIVENPKELIETTKIMSQAAEYIFIDSFLSYIIYRTKQRNANLMSFFSGIAYANHVNFIFCNDTRHVPGEDKPSPAYMEIFRRYSAKNVLVYKDKASNVRYNFSSW